MSHLKERKGRNCLNCNIHVKGRYCHRCGQENIEPKETIWHLVTHFFQDITHFDGKFFIMLKMLVLKPGFLTKEYMLGRRASYVNPVRMYIFTSAFFFLIFFNFFNDKATGFNPSTTNVNGKTFAQVEKMDSAAFADFTRAINRDDVKKDTPMTRAEIKNYFDNVIEKKLLVLPYQSKAHYDSLLQKGTIKHNWIMRQVFYKLFEMSEKYQHDPRGLFNVFKEKLLHSLPQMLFLSLPLIALVLNLLYFRRKQFYYVNHAIFSIHLYIFIFIVLLVTFSLSYLNEQTGWGIFSFINALLYLGIFFYTYKAMRRFYEQRRLKTILKYLLLLVSFYILMGLIFIVFVLFSFFTI